MNLLTWGRNPQRRGPLRRLLTRSAGHSTRLVTGALIDQAELLRENRLVATKEYVTVSVCIHPALTAAR